MSAMVFSRAAITISTGCCRRSAWSTAPLRMLDTESVAERIRTLSMPAAMEGYEMPASTPMMLTTTSISMRVMPLVFPADDVGIQSVAARLAVGAIADDVGLVAVFAGVLVNVVVAPGVFRNFLGHVGAVPLIEVGGLHAQRLQPLLVGREGPGIQLVGAERRLEILDLRARRGDAGLVTVLEHVGGDQRHKQRDDRHDDQHFDESDAGLPVSPGLSASSSSRLGHIYTATSLMLVIASSMLKISAPTIMPITRITIGSNTAVNRLMEARVSFS